MPLLLTSNRWAIQKLWKNWKRLHRLAYGIVIFVILHIVLISWYKNPQTVWYTNTDILIQFSIIIVYFLGKTLEWKGIKLFSWSDIAYPIWQKWLCVPCGYIYDPELWDEDSGIQPGTEFSDIPESWICPECGLRKSDFIPYQENTDRWTQMNATIVEKNLLNPTTIELVIETMEELQSQPGQFMVFLWKDALWEFTRQYSIVELSGHRYAFTIKLSEQSRGSDFLRSVWIGTNIRIRWVFGSFLLRDTLSPKVFIATGTGLAPIYHMIHSLVGTWKEKKNHPKISLYFSVSTEAELFYIEQLRTLPNVDLHIHVTRETVAGFETWRVDIDDIEAVFDIEWYLCGNPKMVTEAKEKLAKRGFERVYSEEF